jgi:hypothetical protein
MLTTLLALAVPELTNVASCVHPCLALKFALEAFYSARRHLM